MATVEALPSSIVPAETDRSADDLLEGPIGLATFAWHLTPTIKKKE
jgi:hypothetical protein